MGEEFIPILLYYGGVWVNNGDGPASFERYKTMVVSVNPNSSFRDLEDEIYDCIEVRRDDYELILKWSSVDYRQILTPPIAVRRDKDVRSLFASIKFKSNQICGLSPLFVEVLPRVPLVGSASGSNHPTSAHPTNPAPCDVYGKSIPLSLNAPDKNVVHETQFDGVRDREGHASGACDNTNFVHDGAVDLNRDDDENHNDEFDNEENDDDGYEIDLNGYDDDAYNGLPDTNNFNEEDENHDNQPPNFPNEERHDHTQPSTSRPSTAPACASAKQSKCSNETTTTSTPIAPGELFMSKKDLQLKLSLYAMKNNFEFKVKKSSTWRYELGCVDKNCKWFLRATLVKDSHVFMVRTFRNTHTCNLDIVHRDHRQATSKVLGECIKSKYAGVARQYRPTDIREDIQQQYGVRITYEKAWRAKEAALHSLWGSPEESYAMLPSYCHQLELRNPGTRTHISTDSNNCFLYFFMALGASIRGFISCMRHVIAVDATHLKDRYRGCLYIASCLDGNSQIYPIAFGIGPGESDEAYIWFFQRLKDAIGQPEELVFISDRHISIHKAIATVYPDVHHGLCMYHISQNMKAKKFAKKDFVFACFFLAAKAYTVSEYNMYMSEIEGHSPAAALYIKELGPARWARSHFPVTRYNIMTTNISESMNSVLRDGRCKPIVPLVEHIRDLLQNWFFKRRNEADKMTSPVSDWLDSELRTFHQSCIRLQVFGLNMNEFRVVGSGDDDTVNLETRSCTCRKFDYDRYPCVHALAACRERNMNYYTMCSSHYTVDTLKQAYAETIYPVGDVKRWDTPPSISSRVVLPPDVVSRPAGRPKKTRIPSLGEDRIHRKCSRCGGIGHNRQTCKNPIPIKTRSSSGSKQSVNCAGNAI